MTIDQTAALTGADLRQARACAAGVGMAAGGSRGHLDAAIGKLGAALGIAVVDTPVSRRLAFEAATQVMVSGLGLGLGLELGSGSGSGLRLG